LFNLEFESKQKGAINKRKNSNKQTHEMRKLMWLDFKPKNGGAVTLFHSHDTILASAVRQFRRRAPSSRSGGAPPRRHRGAPAPAAPGCRSCSAPPPRGIASLRSWPRRVMRRTRHWQPLSDLPSLLWRQSRHWYTPPRLQARSEAVLLLSPRS